VELFVLELSLLFDLFQVSPGLCKRFWRGMALKIANRLSGLHSAPKTEPAKQPQQQETKQQEAPQAEQKEKVLSKDEEFQQKFGLAPTEVILQSIVLYCSQILPNLAYSAAMEQVLSQYGTLYISEHFVCFYSKIFGYESKVKFFINYSYSL
jgi:hypothetical protein